MPYRTSRELPPAVREHLPPRAQDIYRKAFNAAWKEYADPGRRRRGGSREEVAHRVAWAAVKSSYERTSSGKWRPKR